MLVIERHKASKVLRRFESIGAGVVIGDLSCVIEMSPQAQAGPPPTISCFTRELVRSWADQADKQRASVSMCVSQFERFVEDLLLF